MVRVYGAIRQWSYDLVNVWITTQDEVGHRYPDLLLPAAATSARGAFFRWRG